MVPVFLSLALLAVPVSPPADVAPSAAPVQTATAAPAAKPKLICEDDETIGTRLAHSKTCKTAAEWREERMHTRMAVDHAQLQNGIKGN